MKICVLNKDGKLSAAALSMEDFVQFKLVRSKKPEDTMTDEYRVAYLLFI